MVCSWQVESKSVLQLSFLSGVHTMAESAKVLSSLVVSDLCPSPFLQDTLLSARPGKRILVLRPPLQKPPLCSPFLNIL